MFESGSAVYYNNLCGVVNFVCDQYITITISRGAHKAQDCNILVYRNQFQNIIPTNSK